MPIDGLIWRRYRLFLRRLVVVLLAVAGACIHLSVTPAATDAATPVTTLAGGQTGRIHFQAVTLDEKQFLTGAKGGTSAIISGELSLPSQGAGQLPAVVLVHGCAGVSQNVENWAKELNRMGVASFLVDSFSGRGIEEVCTGRFHLSIGSRVVDTYRALEILATHPRIDPSRVALMGFSMGGMVTLQASMKRFQKNWLPTDREFAAYIAFYPGGCNFTFLEDTNVGDRPIRIFHGLADDWTPVGPCKAYIERLRQAGKDGGLLVYAGAYHHFDHQGMVPSKYLPRVLNPSGCSFVEREPGHLVNRDTGRPFDIKDPCISRGATIGYNQDALRQAIQDVKALLQKVFWHER